MKSFFMKMMRKARQAALDFAAYISKKSNGGRPADFYTLVPDPKIKSNIYYVKRLKELIRAKGVTNIALSGDYGTGKSSIIGLFRRRLFSIRRRTRVVSLLTVYDELKKDGSDSDDGSNTNADCVNKDDASKKLDIRRYMQREIFRQLYYGVRPGLLKFSRYSRVGKFPILIYSALIVVCSVAMYFSIIWLGFDVVDINVFIQVGLCLAAAFLVYNVAIRLGSFAQNFSVSGIGAGGVSLNLDSNSPDFEQAIDEFIYFFRRTGCRIVVLEDLDRFRDPRIYEELRQLNIIVNGAKHIHHKIVFIYALRDGLIEDPEQRAKLFDAIVPVVPFMTQDNAVQKIDNVFRTAGFDDAGVIDAFRILARHVKDMRVVRAICNTAITMRDVVGGSTGELKPAEIIAIAAVRELSPEEYENIRIGNGKLDTLYDSCVKMKEYNINLFDTMAKNRKEVPGDMLLTAGNDFWKLVAAPLESNKAYAFDSATLEGSGTFTIEMIDEKFWMKLIDEQSVGFDITYRSTGSYYPSTQKQHKIITIESVKSVGSMRDLIDLLEHDVRYYESKLEESLQCDAFSNINDENKTGIGFLDEFVEIGVIDELYKLYLSPFSDMGGSAELRTFRVKYLNDRTANYLFGLSEQDVETLLVETDAIGLQSPSFYNHSIVKWLVVHDDSRLDIVLRKGENAPAQLLDFFDKECKTYERVLREKYAIRAVSGIVRITNTLFDQINDDYILRLVQKMAQLHPVELLRLLSTTTKLKDTIGKEAIFIVAALSITDPNDAIFPEGDKQAIGSFLDYYEDSIILNGGGLNLAQLRVANKLPTKNLGLYCNDNKANKILTTNMTFELNDDAITIVSDDIAVQKLEKDGITTEILTVLVKNKVSKMIVEYCLGRPDICGSLTDAKTNNLLVQLACRYSIKLSKEQVLNLLNSLSDENIVDLLLISDLFWPDYEAIFAKMRSSYGNIQLGKRPLLRDSATNRRLIAQLKRFGIVSRGPIKEGDLLRLSLRRKVALSDSQPQDT